MWVSNILAGGLLLIIGILIRVFNLSFLIAGYNTSSRENKAKINEKALTRFVGMMLIVSGASLLVGGILICLNIAPVIMMGVSWALMFVIILFGLFFVNLSPRFKNQ